MRSSPLRPGLLCRSRGAAAQPLLLVDTAPGGFLAVPYPAQRDATPIRVDEADLEPIGEDGAAARVLAEQARQRERAREPAVGAATPIDRAMVLCAGLGQRLRPLTLRWPKPAVPFFSAPLVRYSFALLKRAGVREVVINTHHLPEVMERTAATEAERLGLELRVSRETELLGTAGALRHARRFLEGSRFYLLNGDAFVSLDLRALAASHLASGAIATLAVVPMPRHEHYGAVEATADGTVRRIAGVGAPAGADSAPCEPWHFVGVHVIEPALLDFIPEGERDINRIVYPRAIEAGHLVRACPVRLGAWADLGTPGRYLQACEDLMTGLCDLTPFGADAPLDPETSERLRAGGVGARVFVDPRARVEDGARIESSVVSADASVPATARIRRSAILPGTELRDGEDLERCLAAGDLRLGA